MAKAKRPDMPDKWLLWLAERALLDKNWCSYVPKEPNKPDEKAGQEAAADYQEALARYKLELAKHIEKTTMLASLAADGYLKALEDEPAYYRLTDKGRAAGLNWVLVCPHCHESVIRAKKSKQATCGKDSCRQAQSREARKPK